MLKHFVVAVAAIFAAQPALAAPDLNGQTIYVDKSFDVAAGDYGDVVYGTTTSYAPFTPGKEPFDSLTKSDSGPGTPDRAATTQAAKDASDYYANLYGPAGTAYSLAQIGKDKNDWKLTSSVDGINVINFTTAEIHDIKQTLAFVDNSANGVTALIFNIPGTIADASIFELLLPASLTSDKVLFNFFEATELTGSITRDIHGTILAPYATIKVANNFIDGIVIADAFVAANTTVKGNGFNFGPGPGVPEPATWAMMILGFALVGGAMRRRAGFKPVLAA